MINVAGIVEESYVDGEGIRFTIFVQGCPHKCEGCHNPHTWSYNNNKLMSVDELEQRIKDNPLIQGVTFSGGEPFMQAIQLAKLARSVHKLGLDVWCYTGYTYEEILKDETKRILLNNVDVLVDGRFEIDKRDLNLKFRGSSNQRIIKLINGRMVSESKVNKRTTIWHYNHEQPIEGSKIIILYDLWDEGVRSSCGVYKEGVVNLCDDDYDDIDLDNCIAWSYLPRFMEE